MTPAMQPVREIHSSTNQNWHFGWGELYLCAHLCVCESMFVCFMCFNLPFRLHFCFLFSRWDLYTDFTVLLSVRLSGSWLDLVSAPKQITLARGKKQSNKHTLGLNLLLLTSFHKQTPLTFNMCTSNTIQKATTAFTGWAAAAQAFWRSDGKY